jgi:glycosyltransferase involved in cell wall biosynthesis
MSINIQPKVILVANAAFTILNFRKELIQTLLDKGYQVIVACPKECTLMHSNNVYESFEKIGAIHYEIPLSRSGTNPFSEIKLFLSLIKLYRAYKPEIVLNYTIKPTIYSSIASLFSKNTRVYSTITGLGFIFTNNSNTLKDKTISFIVKLQYFLALKFNDLVFFQNNDDLTLLKNLGLLNGVKTKIVNGSGVDMNHFRTRGSEKLKRSFLMVARILKDKGIDEYISAARILKNKYPDAIFQLLGPVDNNLAAYTFSDIEKWQQEGVITYIPPTDDVREYLDRSEVFVLPSYREGTPRSTLEALAMGLPIVTTNAPGCKETVINGKNGFIVEVKNHIELASAMEKFIVSPQIIKKMGQESFKLASDKYDVSAVNKSIFTEILQ